MPSVAQVAQERRRRARAARPARRAMKTSTAGASAVATPSSSIAISSRSIPAPKPTPGRRRAADLLDQVVVAAAARDRRVLVVHRPDELPGRARVVVEPAHERRDELVVDARRVEVGADRGEVLDARVAERLADLRRGLEQLPRRRALDVEDAQRARRAPSRGASASSSSSCSASQARSFSRYAGRHSRQPIEFSSRRYCLTPRRCRSVS